MVKPHKNMPTVVVRSAQMKKCRAEEHPKTVFGKIG